MIVRDEEAVVERALRSAFDFADYFVLVDTGSTDETVTRVRQVLVERPHTVLISAWKGFAESRNEALAVARQHGEYVVFLDADDYFSGDAVRAKAQLAAARAWVCFGYHGWMRHAMTFAVHRDEPFHWSGSRHEFLVGDDGTQSPDYRLLQDFTVRYTHQGARSRQSDAWLNDVNALTDEMERVESADTTTRAARTMFYRARSLQALGDVDAAIIAFQRRAEFYNGDEEERWYSELSATRLLEMQRPDRTWLITKYTNLILARPDRAEPYLDLARQFRMSGRFYEAEKLGMHCGGMNIPDDWVQVDTASYSIHAWDEVAVNCFHTARFDAAAKLWKLSQLFGSQSCADRARIRNAVADCARNLKIAKLAF